MLIGQGKTVADAARPIGVTEPTYSRWRMEFGGLALDQVKRLGGRATHAKSGGELTLEFADRPGKSPVQPVGHLALPALTPGTKPCQMLPSPHQTTLRLLAMR
jgi:hypothetical protein